MDGGEGEIAVCGFAEAAGGAWVGGWEEKRGRMLVRGTDMIGHTRIERLVGWVGFEMLWRGWQIIPKICILTGGVHTHLCHTSHTAPQVVSSPNTLHIDRTNTSHTDHPPIYPRTSHIDHAITSSQGERRTYQYRD